MKMNKKLEIGIKIIHLLVNSKRKLRTKDLSILINNSENKGRCFIEQITAKLKKSKLILPKKGPNGGYSLNKDKTISIYDIAKALNEITDNVGSDSCTKFRVDMLTLLKNSVIVHKESQVNMFDIIDSIYNIDIPF